MVFLWFSQLFQSCPTFDANSTKKPQRFPWLASCDIRKVRRKRLDVGMGKDETHLGDLPWYPSMDWRGKSTGNFAGGIPLKMVVYH